MFKRKLNTVKNKAQIKFINKKMAFLGLLEKFIARNSGNIYFKLNCGIRICPKRENMELWLNKLGV